jgi:hypothetical protein
MLPLVSALRSAGGYVLQNPFLLAKFLKHALGFRAAIPLDALRWLTSQLPKGRKAPQQISIGAKPPAISVGATFEMMNTKLRGSAAIRFTELRFNESELHIALQLSEVELKLVEDSESPIAALIKSGALDLSKPGNLVKFMPKKPAAIVQAQDDRIALDLMQVKKLARNPTLRRILSLITPVFTLVEIRTEGDLLLIGFRATPSGLSQTLLAARG